MSTGKNLTVSATDNIPVNSIDKSDRTEDLHFVRTAEEYRVSVLGRTGEPRQDRVVRLTLKHRDFRQSVSLSLKT